MTLRPGLGSVTLGNAFPLGHHILDWNTCFWQGPENVQPLRTNMNYVESLRGWQCFYFLKNCNFHLGPGIGVRETTAAPTPVGCVSGSIPRGRGAHQMCNLTVSDSGDSSPQLTGSACRQGQPLCVRPQRVAHYFYLRHSHSCLLSWTLSFEWTNSSSSYLIAMG